MGPGAEDCLGKEERGKGRENPLPCRGLPVGVQSGGRKIFQVDHSGYHHIPTTASQTASLGFIPASQLHLPWVPLHPKHITLFITSPQLDRPGYHGNLTTSLWVPPQPSAHPVSNPQPTPPSPSPQLFALVSQRPVPAGAGGREDSLDGPEQQMLGSPSLLSVFTLFNSCPLDPATSQAVDSGAGTGNAAKHLPTPL